MKNLVALLIMLFSAGIALIAFAGDKPVKDKAPAEECAEKDAECRYRAAMDSADFEQALECAEALVAAGPDSGRSWYRKARALHKLDEKLLAVDAYETALEKGYESFYALNNVGLLYLLMGENDKALQRLEQAVAMEGAKPYAFSNLGTAYQRAGELDKARKAFVAALDMDPDYALAAARLADVEKRIAKHKDEERDSGETE